MSQEHIILTIKEIALSDPSQKSLINKLQIVEKDQIIVELGLDHDIFGSEMVLDKELIDEHLVLYLF